MSQPLLDQVLDELKYSTRLMIEVDGTIDASCASNRINLDADANTACTTTYDGATIPWNVDISDDYSPTGTLVEYEVSPEGAILIGPRVYADFWTFYRDKSDQLRCDDLPRAAAVGLNLSADDDETVTSYHCEYLGPAQHNTRTWVMVPITVDQNGDIGFTPV